ncbi:NADPH-dependent FMN reductase [Pararcticibacter amylolyticus]|uniref:NADPH-dependent FMN reductase n=1 Tax=Pararcticibacter amylolyticus TaxID=2173175 RepID=A0A2U2PFS6_9SPHI|nr:NAD(P)H-dependent oxidoreductase [Pararcticibacter amylolyticus]PWG80246.1 NADPH-dependent FMN reductase [Pararcticibacter amylolyticus]
MFNLKIINSTTRPGRKGPVIAAWIAETAKKHPEFNIELLDLGEINLPMMDEPSHPRLQKYEHQHTKDWSAKINEADAFIMVTAEYNFAFPAPLKNALDYLAHEWAYKPVGIVSYGGASGGTRSAQMLKQVLTTLKMVPLVETVALPFYNQFLTQDDQFNPNEITAKAAEDMLNELVRWAEALKPLRGK